MEICPENKNIEIDKNDDIECSDECEEGQYISIKNNKKYCVDDCSESDQFLYDGKDFEENILGVEPDWVKQKRKHDYFEGFNDNHISLTKKKLLQQKKYFLEELKEQEEVLKRTKKL